MIAEIKKTTEQKMQKSLDALKADLGKVRTGRAHTGMLDHVMVEYYGNPTLITQVANVTLIDARTIGVQPWEKNMVGPVEQRDPRCRSGAEPGHQRRPDPRADADADRRAPPRPDQGDQDRRRDRQDCGAQHTPRCQQHPEGCAQETRKSPKTKNAAPRTTCRS